MNRIKPPSLFKVAVIIVTVWIIFLYQQYLHTATYNHGVSTQYLNHYGEFDPVRHVPLCRDNITTSKTQRYGFDGRTSSDDQCRNELDRVTVHMPDHVPGLTEEDYERSMAHVGNRYRIATFVQKLIRSTKRSIDNNETTDSTSTGTSNNNPNQNNKPVTVVVCGGSITMGHGVEPQSARYSDALEDWLNEAYPVAVDNSTNTKESNQPGRNDGNYNYSNEYPNRHRVFMRGGHGANVRTLPGDIFLFLVRPCIS